MSDVPEHDQRLLEAYLDDALSASEVQLVDERLTREPGLREALVALRNQRAIRAAAWQSLHEEQTSGEELVRVMRRAVARHEGMRRVVRGARLGAAMAACVALFCGGWVIRSAWSPPARVAGPLPSRVRHSVPPPDAAGIYRVALTDEAGQVIAVQPFTKLEEARRFADDLERYEARRREVRQGSPMLVSDHF